MPFKSRELQRKYQREVRSRRYRAWIEEHGPCANCGSHERLEIDHVDRSTKSPKLIRRGGTANVFSWSQARRDEELSKCQVLCKSCHLEKTRLEFLGRPNRIDRKLTWEQARAIREMLSLGVPGAHIAATYRVHKSTISRIALNQQYVNP